MPTVGVVSQSRSVFVVTSHLQSGKVYGNEWIVVLPIGAVSVPGMVTEFGASHVAIRLWAVALRPCAGRGISHEPEWSGHVTSHTAGESTIP